MPPPQDIDRPAAKASSLQTALKTKPLESTDVEFSRQSLRKTYQDMLFSPRSAGGASPGKLLDILSLLWMDTTHALIAKYRAKVTQIDKAIAEHAPQQSDTGHGHGRGRAGKRGAGDQSHQGPVARRRVVQSFRAFLKKEEEYWTSLLVKMINSFDVAQATVSLSALGISASVLTSSANASERSNGLVVDDRLESRRGRPDQVPAKIALLLCHRALISLGDLARYKDLYSESPANTGKSHSGNKRSGGAGAGPGSTTATSDSNQPERSFARAAACYNQARRLVPDDGQPFNQLAVLASYDADQLASVYYYLRAGCVKQDFKTAQPNLEMTLAKALKKYQDAPVDPSTPTAQLFLDDFVALQAMIYLQKTDLAVVESQLGASLELYRASLSSRALAGETILKIICTCIAAWHSDRMPHHASSPPPAAPANSSDIQGGLVKKADTESMVLQLVLGYLGATFRESAQSVEGMFEGKIPTEPASRDTVASRISPLLRRALPAIRVGSKWLLGRASSGRLATYGKHVSAFWNDYATLVNVLARRFPTRYLPDMPNELVLEENVDLAGFLPLSGALRAPTTAQGLRAIQEAGAGTHPNYEHLMRIADVLSDAALIASSHTTPVSLERGVFTVKFELNPTAQHFQPPNFLPSPGKTHAAAAAAAAPSASAVITSDGEEEDDEEDEVLLRDVSAAHLLESHQYQDDSDVVDLAMRAATMTHSHEGQAEQMLNPSVASPRLSGQPLPERNSSAGVKSTSSPPGNQNTSDLLSHFFNSPLPNPHTSPRQAGNSLTRPTSTLNASPSLRGLGLPPPLPTTEGGGTGANMNSIWGPAPASKDLFPPTDAARSLWNNSPAEGGTGRGAFGAAPLRRDSRGTSQLPSTLFGGPFG